MALLEVHNLTKNFGGLTAVLDLDFDVFEEEILGMIGWHDRTERCGQDHRV